jgi:hypothetical protein
MMKGQNGSDLSPPDSQAGWNRKKEPKKMKKRDRNQESETGESRDPKELEEYNWKVAQLGRSREAGQLRC